MNNFALPKPPIPSDAQLKGTIIDNKYFVGPLIGKGSFGQVYTGTIIKTGETIALKLEKKANIIQQLRHEYSVCFYFRAIKIELKHNHIPFQIYHKLRDCPGIVVPFDFGQLDHYNFFAMKLLGPSLEILFNYCNRRFTVPTALKVGIQMLQLIEPIHEHKIIHRDIKPENFVLRSKSVCAELCLIDFGLSKRYVYLDKHVAAKNNCSFTGTARYASINSQSFIEQSRRDDLESIGYILVYLINGSLPWQNLKGFTDREMRKRRILQIKKSVALSTLCANMPIEIQCFLKYCRELAFEERPNYIYLRKLLQ